MVPTVDDCRKFAELSQGIAEQTTDEVTKKAFRAIGLVLA